MIMCLRPLYLIRKCEHCDFIEDSWRSSKLVRVPCGKCIECVKRRQSDLTVRVVTEAQNYKTMHFVTLTYNPESVPLACSLFCRTKDGVYLVQKPHILPEADFCRKMRECLNMSDIDGRGRFLDASLPFSADWCKQELPYFYRVAMSLNREHFKNWMKLCRTRYQREFGEKLPDFKMAWCGEYGSRTARPHYHALFLGLTSNQVDWMCKQWEYGFTLWKRCKTDASDKYAVARYISKYMAKEADFKCDLLKWNLVEKPRVAVSRYLGYNPDLSKSYFYAFDLFGEYDPESLRLKENNMPLSLKQQDDITDAISKRLLCYVPGCDYSLPLPISWLHQIYYKKVKNEIKKTVRFVPSRLFKIVSEALLARDLADREREFISFASSFTHLTTSEIVLRFNSFKANEIASKEVSGKKSEIAFYSSDSF